MSSSVEVYGFIGWITTLVGFALYLLWALTPDEVFEANGIWYYPDKHWALTIPLLLTSTIVYIFTGYEFLNMMIVQTPREFSTTQDSTPMWTKLEVQHALTKEGHSIPPLKDIPIDIVSQHLYLTRDE